VEICRSRVTCWSLWHCAPLYCVSNTQARCIFFSFCFGLNLFLTQVDNETLAVCDISGCKDVDVPSGCSGGLVPVEGGGGGVLPVCQSRLLSISVSLLCQTLGWSLILFLFIFFFIFGFAFYLYVCLGLSLHSSSVVSAGNQPFWGLSELLRLLYPLQNLFNYRKCCLKSLFCCCYYYYIYWQFVLNAE